MSLSRLKVVGFKRWAGTLDGKAIDSAKVFVEVRLDGSRNDKDARAEGFCTEEIRLPSSELLKRVEHLPLPFEVEVETERLSNGKTTKDVVIDLRPVGIVKPGPAKVAA